MTENFRVPKIAKPWEWVWKQRLRSAYKLKLICYETAASVEIKTSSLDEMKAIVQLLASHNVSAHLTVEAMINRAYPKIKKKLERIRKSRIPGVESSADSPHSPDKP